MKENATGNEPDIEVVHTLRANTFFVTNRIEFQRVHTPEGIIVRQVATAVYETAPLEADTAAEMVQVQYGMLLARALEDMAQLLMEAGNTEDTP